MKQTVDKKRKDVYFTIGDMVFLKLHPYRQQSVYKRTHPKLPACFYGPYPILEKVGLIAYKLQLLEGTSLHLVFHVPLLKHYIRNNATPSTDIPPFSNDGAIQIQPQAILDTRWVKFNH